MKRKDFIKKSAGLSLLAALAACARETVNPADATSTSTTAGGNTPSTATDGTCVASPAETAGPYPYDLSGVSKIFRSDITEGKTGVPLALTLTVVNVNNSCSPVENARIDIWHCDKDGYYSEYVEPGYFGTKDYKGQTFLRGIQLTDSSGQVHFSTIYPGWYSGRIAHIHIEVFIGSALKLTTQLAFPDDVNQAVYETDLYKTHGQNTSVANNAADLVFGDSHTDLEHEICTIAANAATGGYDASLTVGVKL